LVPHNSHINCRAWHHNQNPRKLTKINYHVRIKAKKMYNCMWGYKQMLGKLQELLLC
jgi:hypothetical protein